MSFLYFDLPSDYISTFFETIQNMKMCLLTLFGISSSFYTGSYEQPF